MNSLRINLRLNVVPQNLQKPFNRSLTISGGVVSLDMLLILISIPFCAKATSFNAVKNPF